MATKVKYLATEDLLSQLRALESRPWSAWTGKSGRRLAGYLRPFAISGRRLHPGSGNPFMAYLLKDFQDAWERYLPPPSASVELEPVEVLSSQNPAPQLMAS